MNVVAFILLLVAAVTFGWEFSRFKSALALGLTFMTVGLIFQYAANTHTFHF